eukprot:TRINITY_DN1714_c3_g1_i1.p1 TRINITY_DN1714_c3_g1~~TRINITY_DN1714_c3_g1_i1.p1  ORF type:complete len:428 (-),score=159.35 TRINITY_DN1714_c3_g1_i1:86-1369(-)
MAKYDLVTSMCPFLDRHLILPLVQFLHSNNVYPQQQMLKAKIDLLQKTNMVDFAKECFVQRYPDRTPPINYNLQREKIVSKMTKLLQVTEKLRNLINNEQINVKAIDFPQKLIENNISNEAVNSMYTLAKFLFDCGLYSQASEILASYYFMIPNDETQQLKVLWGKFACEILMRNWDIAYLDYNKIKEYIETTTFNSPLEALNYRAWLANWSLFLFFGRSINKNSLLDLLLNEQFSYVIQFLCPYLLRYVAATAILRGKKASREILRLIQQEESNYSDPITKFFDCLAGQLNFYKIKPLLKEMENVIAVDYFLSPIKDEFMESARQLVFDYYSRVSISIKLSTLADILSMEKNVCERWVLNLVRIIRADIKLDFQNDQILITPHISLPHQQILEKTKTIVTRCSTLITTLSKTNEAPEEQNEEVEQF